MNNSLSNFHSALRELLIKLPKIESDVFSIYDCEEIRETVNLHKESIKFALSMSDEVKAFYEANVLEDLYIDLLTS